MSNTMSEGEPEGMFGGGQPTDESSLAQVREAFLARRDWQHALRNLSRTREINIRFLRVADREPYPDTLTWGVFRILLARHEAIISVDDGTGGLSVAILPLKVDS